MLAIAVAIEATGWVLIIGAIVVPCCGLIVQLYQMHLNSKKEADLLIREANATKQTKIEATKMKRVLRRVSIKQEAVLESNNGMKIELVKAVKEAAKLQGGVEERVRADSITAAIAQGRNDEQMETRERLIPMPVIVDDSVPVNVIEVNKLEQTNK